MSDSQEKIYRIQVPETLSHAELVSALNNLLYALPLAESAKTTITTRAPEAADWFEEIV